MAIADKARIGFPVPQIFTGGAIDQALMRQVVCDADALGYDSLWTQEQQFGRANSLEPLVSLAAAAALTAHARIGVSVLVMARHNPIQLAKQLASLDQLAGGRLIVGVGAGRPNVAPGVEGMQTDRRLLRLEEGIGVMRALWANDDAVFDGKLWRLNGVSINPKPLQRPGVPLWFGASADAALRRAARLGDGWMGAGSSSVDDFKQQLPKVRAMLEEEGRDPAAFAVGKRVYVAIDSDSDRAERRLKEWFAAYYDVDAMASRVSIWGPERIVAERLEEIADSGAQTMLLNPVFDLAEHQAALAELCGLAPRAA